MNHRDLQQLAANLRADRARAGLTIRDLAEKSGVKTTAIVRLEAAVIEKPQPEYLKRLALALGSDVEDYYAYAGYLVPEGLPELLPYLRAKYDLPEQAANQIDEYFQALRSGWTRQRPQERDDDSDGDKAA